MQRLPLILNVLQYALVATIAVYLMVAIGLTMLAARLRSSGAWMAWIPFVNFILLCKLARSSPAWVIPALIPGVGFIVLAYLGARVAKRLGQSGFIGALFGVPLVGAIVPIPLALAGKAPAIEPGQTGRASSLGLVQVGIALGVIAVAIASFVAIGWMTRSTPVTAEQAVAALPQRTVGTLTVFPLDTDTARPAKPGNVVTQNFGSLAKVKQSPGTVNVKPQQLPPWIAPESLPLSAESVAAADYRVEPDDQPVTVVVLVMRDGESIIGAPPTKQQMASLGADAAATGIEVKSTAGDTYRGYRVQSSDSAYYALQKGDSPTSVVISANKGADLAMAERLALGVGNGKGLLEYEDYTGSFGDLPAAPAGMELGQVMTFTSTDINAVVEQATAELAAMPETQNPAIGNLIAQARLVLPSRLSVADYTGDTGEKGAVAAIAGYANSRSAWVAMQTFGFFVKNSTSLIRTAFAAAGNEGDAAELIEMMPAVQSITVGDASGYTATYEGMSAILLRRGGSISLLVGETGVVDLAPWAAAYAAK